MTEVSRILSAMEQGDPQASEQLLPLVYEELRRIAAQRLAEEAPGHTLQATALVHEVYLRLVDVETAQSWSSRGHFFAAAAESMRRILIDHARRRKAEKRGGNRQRVPLDLAVPVVNAEPDELLSLDDALRRLSERDEVSARLVELRYFGGLSVDQAAESLGLSRATAYRHWSFARAWLHRQLAGEPPSAGEGPISESGENS